MSRVAASIEINDGYGAILRIYRPEFADGYGVEMRDVNTDNRVSLNLSDADAAHVAAVLCGTAIMDERRTSVVTIDPLSVVPYSVFRRFVDLDHAVKSLTMQRPKDPILLMGDLGLDSAASQVCQWVTDARDAKRREEGGAA